MSRFIIPGLAWSGLLTGLALTVFAPELANDAMLVIMLLSLPCLTWVPQRGSILRHPCAVMPLAAGVLLIVAFIITARSALHVAAVLVFIHLFMVGPLAGLLSGLGRHLTLERIALFAMIGTAGGAVVAVIDVYVLGSARAGLVNNPIHLADITLMVGFVALVGLWGDHRLRLLFVLGPVLALITVLLSGSRGPLVAAIVMAMVAALALGLSTLPPKLVWRTFWTAIAAVLIGTVALAVFAWAQGFWPFQGLVIDSSTDQRLIMYEAAAKAFLASPLAGHGLLDYFAAARAQMPEGIEFPQYAHLHNDLADFAVAGGMLGIGAYLLFLLAPMVGAARARGRLRIPSIYLGAVTSVGYFTMGMTNAMLGLRWQDIVLATILAILVVLSERDEESFDVTAQPIHIALTFDDNFWAPAFATMRSVCLFTHRREDLVFHLCHRTLSPRHRADLESITAEFPVALRWYDLDASPLFADIAARMPENKRLSNIVYARLMIDRLLGPDVARVLYLDCDMLVRDNIEKLFDWPMEDKPIAAVRDTMGAFITGRRDLKSNRDIFDSADPYFNAGMVLIDVAQWRAADIIGQMEQAFADGVMARIYYDQDFLNLVFAGNWLHLPWRWNTIDARHAHEGLDPAILHYTGENKPWGILSGMLHSVAFGRLYRHVMTNELFYRFARHRWKRWWKKRLGLGK